MIEIRQAKTELDFSIVGDFYHSFRDWLRQTYPEFGQWAEAEAFFNELESEIKSLPGIYAPPAGSLLIATYNGTAAGTVGLADLGQNQCEMRRMFVDSHFRGAKIGRALGEAVIIDARARGYTKMRLGSLPRHFAALGLYRSLGFQVIDQANHKITMPEDFPEDLQGGPILMELEL